MLSAWLPGQAALAAKIKQQGPAATCVPRIKACFVRRKEQYGIWWPGQIYDGEAARKKYTRQIAETAKKLNMKLDLASSPIYSEGEAQAWVAQAAADKPDGLLVVVLDRQKHAWPTAYKAVDSGIPTVVFSPVGTAFTTNTEPLAEKPGCFICSTDDFRQVKFGMKMLHARAKMRATRCLVIRGSKKRDVEMPQLGIGLRYIPAATFLDEYNNTPVDQEIEAMAKELIQGARRMRGATDQDVINGIKSYVVARRLLERENADAITMDCLGALGRSKVSLPCIAWSKMNDDAIPAACEADLGAVASHIMVQYLFDRPGFQQDPVPETAKQAVIGAHCSCPTKLDGFSAESEPYDIVHHHGARDATRRTLWKKGQRVTSVDVIVDEDNKNQPSHVLIATGEVMQNLSAPPAGGCVVSVMFKLDGNTNVLSYPGFHQVWFHGDYGRELSDFCRLLNIKSIRV
ncbi:MAG: hypothetical protein ACWGMZ_01440 [Thermoguttaceae bacterium]